MLSSVGELEMEARVAVSVQAGTLLRLKLIVPSGARALPPPAIQGPSDLTSF